MARKDSDHQKKSMSLLFRGKAIFKPLNTGRIDEHVACVREWVANIYFYTKNNVTIMIDAGYNYARLREKGVWRAIIALVVPSVLTILIMVVYNIADMFFFPRRHRLYRRDREPLSHRRDAEKSIPRAI